MRLCRGPLALAALILLAGSAAAQSRVKITSTRVGLPPGRFVTDRDEDGSPAHVVKNNTWAPVYVAFEILRPIDRELAIVIETADADDLGTTTWVPLQNLSDRQPGSRVEPTELRFLPYVRPSGRGELSVKICEYNPTDRPANWRAVGEPFRIRYLHTRDASRYVVLSLGTKLPGFDLPNENAGDGDDNQQRALRNGRVETAAITEVNDLPDRWYGYDAADLVVLTTGAAAADKFLTPLFTDPQHKSRVDALVEWVRRGGRLVVSAGINTDLLLGYPVLQELLPVGIRRDPAKEQVKELNLEWSLTNTNTRAGLLSTKQGTPFPVANTVPKPDRGFRQLMPAFEDGAGNRPRVVTQSAHGLGRVTFVGFDLDRSPFVDFAGRAKVWDLILRECGSARASVGNTRGGNNTPRYGGIGDTEDEFAQGLRAHIDTFDGVPVVSFGWVAVFIVLYTLLIGPVEYLFLKKVLKRLELTWVTFPIIVLTVSAIAYFTAYALKGDDLKVNKVDVVDIDPATGRIYGRSWFTVFSPRIESYKIGIEPNAGWAAADTVEKPHPGSLVDWAGGSRSGRGGSFFRRSYYYKLDPPGVPGTDGGFSAGLVDVPIQVWSTKAFSADWSANIDPTSLVVSDLVHPPSDPRKVTGTFTLNLPVPELKSAYLLYAGKAYPVENPIVPGGPVTVLLDKDDPDWLSKVGNTQAVTALANRNDYNYGRRGNQPAVSVGSASLFGMLFHDAQPGGDDKAPVNATLRRLDQSWRLTEHHRDEVIVVGKLAAVKGRGQDVIEAADSASPTKLWLKDLPARGKAWPGLNGSLQQETFVRVYVPVKPAKR